MHLRHIDLTRASIIKFLPSLSVHGAHLYTNSSSNPSPETSLSIHCINLPQKKYLLYYKMTPNNSRVQSPKKHLKKSKN